MHVRSVRSLLSFSNLRLVALDRQLAELSVRLAASLRLRGADAAYVAAALRLGVPLMTWDDEQRARTGRVIVARTP